jgi:hypothetical protein
VGVIAAAVLIEDLFFGATECTAFLQVCMCFLFS